MIYLFFSPSQCPESITIQHRVYGNLNIKNLSMDSIYYLEHHMVFTIYARVCFVWDQITKENGHHLAPPYYDVEHRVAPLPWMATQESVAWWLVPLPSIFVETRGHTITPNDMSSTWKRVDKIDSGHEGLKSPGTSKWPLVLGIYGPPFQPRWMLGSMGWLACTHTRGVHEGRGWLISFCLYNETGIDPFKVHQDEQKFSSHRLFRHNLWNVGEGEVATRHVS